MGGERRRPGAAAARGARELRGAAAIRGTNVFKEVCHGMEQDMEVTLTPEYTDKEYSEFLQLLTPELSETCTRDEKGCTEGVREGQGCFEAHLAAGTAPAECGYDCAHLFFVYSEHCAHFLMMNHPNLAGFTKQCTATHEEMQKLSVDGHLDEGQQADHDFHGEKGVIYTSRSGRAPISSGASWRWRRRGRNTSSRTAWT
jgi:hypothetical protein